MFFWVSPPPLRWACARASVLTASKAQTSGARAAKDGRMGNPLELRANVELHRVHIVSGTVDRICAQVPKAQPHAFGDTIVAGHVIAGRVGAAEVVKIRVGESIEHRIALQITVTDQGTPGAGMQHVGRTKADFALITLGARGHIETRARENFPLIEPDIVDRVAGDLKRIPAYRDRIGCIDVDQAKLRRQGEEIAARAVVVADIEHRVAAAEE